MIIDRDAAPFAIKPRRQIKSGLFSIDGQDCITRVAFRILQNLVVSFVVLKPEFSIKQSPCLAGVFE